MILISTQARLILIIALALMPAAPVSLSQQQKDAEQTSADILLMRLAPGRWFYDARGDVRSIETEQFSLVKRGGQWIEARTSSQTIYFDRRGFETETIDGDEGKTVWKYDAQGRVAEMTMSLDGLPFSREVYSYDFERRRLIVETYILGSDKLRARSVSTFDERWNEVRKENETFSEDGKASQPERDVVVYKREYDSKGRTVVETIGGEDNSISYRFTFEYGDANSLVRNINYQYDQQSGALLSKTLNNYDERGLLRESLNYDPRGRLQRRETYAREFDAHGNWITERQMTWSSDMRAPSPSFTFIKRRKITYY